MKTKFICLANSKKYGERCIAGIELLLNEEGKYIVVRDDGQPKWIRPISKEDHGEVASKLVGHIQLNDVVELDVIQASPNGYQSENVMFDADSISIIHKIRLSSQNLDFFTVQRNNLFGNKGKAVHSDMIGSLDYSLLSIKVKEPRVYVSTDHGKNQLRMKFNYSSTEYDLPITDITFDQKYRSNNSILTNANHIYLTISLGVLYESWYYKLIAGVIYL